MLPHEFLDFIFIPIKSHCAYIGSLIQPVKVFLDLIFDFYLCKFDVYVVNSSLQVTRKQAAEKRILLHILPPGFHIKAGPSIFLEKSHLPITDSPNPIVNFLTLSSRIQKLMDSSHAQEKRYAKGKL